MEYESYCQKRSQSQKLKTAKTLRTGDVKAQQAKLRPKTVICNLLITIPLSHDYWTVYEVQTKSNNATLSGWMYRSM